MIIDSDQSAFLHLVGSRVRRARARRGMSRRILAEASQVSERYLAQLEAGKGNISIVLLRQIAAAMDIGVDDLVRETEGTSLEFALLLDRLRNADPAELKRIHELVTVAAPFDEQRDGRIALIGLRGAGKSTLGPRLAEHLGCPFIELVEEIEAAAGMDVSEIFSLGGQSTYRRFEQQCLDQSIHDHSRVVLAIGGSLVSEPKSFERLLNSCVTVWLRAEPEDHMNRVIAQGDRRPMTGHPQAMDDLRRILDERQSLYERAQFTLYTAGKTVEQSMSGLLRLPPLRARSDHGEAA